MLATKVSTTIISTKVIIFEIALYQKRQKTSINLGNFVLIINSAKKTLDWVTYSYYLVLFNSIKI